MVNQPPDGIRLFSSNFLDETKKIKIFAEIVLEVRIPPPSSTLMVPVDPLPLYNFTDMS